ncbi:hypothetical protein A4A49_24864 [Nicotiana attenuata]|uniref:Uncharacterized protein n=1 Tax=Nicotiana attenuata TaxID=49451 RepID=A0A1J6IB45_NICAT|nr:hypothetical protein A4A49_24864 [Nicotiana attenuata]
MKPIGDHSTVEKDQAKPTCDIPATTALARLYKAVSSALQTNTTLDVIGDRANTLIKAVEVTLVPDIVGATNSNKELVVALDVNEEAGHSKQVVENPTDNILIADPTATVVTRVLKGSGVALEQAGELMQHIEAATNGVGTKREGSTATPGATSAQDTHLEVVVGKDESDVGQKVCEGQLTRKSKGGGTSKVT